MPLSYDIVTPERRVENGACDEVRAPGVQGSFGIRSGHASFLTQLQPGTLVVVVGGREELFAVTGGFLQIERDKVLVLADAAERRDEIDVARARRALEEANSRLRAMSSDLDPNYPVEAARVRRAAARLSVVGS
ncbi:MAG TPA: F0F1 ATP synthase subunit epsilon [Anaeromyxobacteraceae bacterium]|nr:F0F1 ATP synthase subunit epsilon [Anaeromyxobacteraceae bacterium]